jgi:chromosome segregation ATPase
MNQELRGQHQEKCQTLDKLQREHDSRLMNAVALENTVAERRPAAASTSKDEVTKLKEALRMMTNRNRDLNARLESIEGIVANPSSSSSFKTVQELLAQTAQCQVLLKDYSDREDAIVKDLATKDIKISGLQEKLELSSERVEALMEELSTKEETCSDLKKQLDELKTQTGATLNALSKTSLNDSATAEELAKKFQEIKELKEQCSNLEKLTEWWKGHSTGLQNDLVVLSSKYNRLVDAYHHQTNQYKAELQTISAHTWPGQYGHNASYFHAPDTKGTSKKRWHEIVGLASTDNLIERQVPETGDDGNSRFFKCHRVSYEHLAVKQAPPS